MVRGTRVSRRAALILAALAVGGAGCSKRKDPPAAAIEQIRESEPNRRARALRAEMDKLFAAARYDDAAAKTEAMARAVGDLLEAMDALHHKKRAVPDFAVIRYVEALRDLGGNLRGFSQMYTRENPEALKREMLQGLLEQIRQKIW
jgi:regulator of protease activity HflC (stomatin/prohibitin superfamily)